MMTPKPASKEVRELFCGTEFIYTCLVGIERTVCYFVVHFCLSDNLLSIDQSPDYACFNNKSFSGATFRGAGTGRATREGDSCASRDANQRINVSTNSL
jgi:hypothetical protein